VILKFIVFLVVIFAVVWFMRPKHLNAPRRDNARSAPTPPPPPLEMVECAVCHVHLPRTDALAGPDGRLYCCADHRQRGGA
jgi:uncharacterized protein